MKSLKINSNYLIFFGFFKLLKSYLFLELQLLVISVIVGTLLLSWSARASFADYDKGGSLANLTMERQPVVISPGRVPKIPVQAIQSEPKQIQIPLVRPIKLRSRTIFPGQTDVSERLEALHDLITTSITMEGPIHLLVQLESLPTEADRVNLKEQGIELLEYVPENTWIAGIEPSCFCEGRLYTQSDLD